ncbi:MAG: DMT family transporter [Cyanobacteria bacterium P01_H01_bin.121]
MLTLTRNPYHQSLILLLLTPVVWGTSFPLLKGVVADLSPGVILAVRFMVAAIAVAPWLRHAQPKLVRAGLLLGSLYFTECALTLTGLQTIPASRSAFIVSLNAVFVPLFSLVLGRQLSQQILWAAGVAVLGIGLMSWDGGGLQVGDVLTFMGAIGIAIYILLLERIASQHPTLPLVAVQLMVMASFSTLWALPDVFAQTQAIATHFGTLLYVGLVITAGPIWTQALAQRWVPSYKAALIYTLEPVFAALFASLILGEVLGPQGMVGSFLVVTAMLWSQRRDAQPAAPEIKSLQGR